VLGDPGGGDDVARVHPILRVEGALELPEGPHERGAVHPFEERAPRAAVAVLARDRPAELDNEVGDLLGDRAHLLEAARRLQVDDRADVQAPHRAVAVVGADGLVLSEDLAKPRHELGELPGLDARVLDERDRLFVALHPEEEPEPGLAELPDGLLLCGAERDVRGVAEALALAAALERLDLGLHLRIALARVLDDQDRLGVAPDEAHAVGLFDVPPRQVQDHLVGQLDRIRAGLEDRLRGFERLLQIAVVDDVERGRRRTPHEADLGLE
jgi:hypothetical protein